MSIWLEKKYKRDRIITDDFHGDRQSVSISLFFMYELVNNIVILVICLMTADRAYEMSSCHCPRVCFIFRELVVIEVLSFYKIVKVFLYTHTHLLLLDT